MIEHIPKPEAALKELARVLRNNGVLIRGYPLEHAFLMSLKRMYRIEKRLRLRIRGEVCCPEEKTFPTLHRPSKRLVKINP